VAVLDRQLLERLHVDVQLLLCTHLCVLCSLLTLDVVDHPLKVAEQDLSDLALRVLAVFLALLNLEDHELTGDCQPTSHHGRQLFETAQNLHAPVPPNFFIAIDVSNTDLSALFELDPRTYPHRNCILQFTSPVLLDTASAVLLHIAVSGVKLFILAADGCGTRHGW